MIIKRYLPYIALLVALISLTLIWTDHKPVAKLTQKRTTVASAAINLLNQDWSYALGVTPTAAGLQISATDFKIVEQDGSGGQPNPPLNLYGTHLHSTGNFRIDVKLANLAGDGSVQVYAAPPVIADEFRIESPSVKLTETANSLQVDIWNGVTGNVANQPPFYTHKFTINNGDTIGFSKVGDVLIINDGQQQLAKINKAGKIFSTGNEWFGLTSSNGGCDVSLLQAEGLDSGTVTAIDSATTNIASPATGTGLQALAAKQRPGFKVGAAVALGPIVADPAYASELTNNFGSITPENLMKWQFIEPEQGQFSFQQADALVYFAQKNGMIVHGHTLVFSEANPDWVQDLPTATAADKQNVKAVMLNHISTVVGHFKGKVASWDVVNEPLQDYDTFDPSSGQILRDNKWYQAMGSDYIAEAFQAAHAADSAAKLYINEYGLEAGGERWDTFYNLVKNLKAAGVPIDGVGFESHVYDAGDKIDPSVLKSHIDQLAKIGLQSRVSEMDVYDDDGLAVQTQQYSAVFQMCLADTNCVSFTTWGVDDRYDVFQDDDHTLEFGNDLLFDHGKATPAYTALETILGKK